MTSGSFTNYVPHCRIRIENEEAVNLAETFFDHGKHELDPQTIDEQGLYSLS